MSIVVTSTLLVQWFCGLKVRLVELWILENLISAVSCGKAESCLAETAVNCGFLVEMFVIPLLSLSSVLIFSKKGSNISFILYEIC
jgi:hypothetical protein